MSDGVKIQGIEDVRRLMRKDKTWTPPRTLDEFLTLVRTVIETSKYTDSFIRGDGGITLRNLRTFVEVKATRVSLHPDIEECVDVAAYAYMVFHLFLREAGIESLTTESKREDARTV